MLLKVTGGLSISGVKKAMNILGRTMAMSCCTDEGMDTTSIHIFNDGIRFRESVNTSSPFLGQPF